MSKEQRERLEVALKILRELQDEFELDREHSPTSDSYYCLFGNFISEVE